MNIVHFDDDLVKPECFVSRVARGLQAKLGSNCTYDTIGTYDDAARWLSGYTLGARPDLFICDHNLYWPDQDGHSGDNSLFRYGCGWMQYVFHNRVDWVPVPVVVLTDSPKQARSAWNKRSRTPVWKHDISLYDALVCKYAEWDTIVQELYGVSIQLMSQGKEGAVPRQ